MDAHLYPIEKLIQTLNWSRNDLADYMGISRQALYLYMEGKRDIKGIHKLRFSQLFLMTVKGKEDKGLLAQIQKAEKDALRATLEKRNQSLKQEIVKAEKQLAEVKLQYATLFPYYQRLMHMDESMHNIKLSTTEKQKLEEMKIYWRNQLNKFDASRQHSIALRIHLLRQELAFNGKVK